MKPRPAKPISVIAQASAYRKPADRRSRPQRWRDAVAELVELQDEYRAWLDSLPDNLAESSDLTRHNVEVKVQEDFKDLGGDTLDKLDAYIADCDGVVHLAGDMTGSAPGEHALNVLRAKYPDLADKLPPLGEALRNGSGGRRRERPTCGRSDAPDLQCLSSPHHELVEPRLGGPDDFRVHLLDQPVDR